MNKSGRNFKSLYPLETKIDDRGYEILVRRGRGNFCIKMHHVIAGKALGRALPENAEVHHHNGVKRDNRNRNLIICPDRAYHFLLHTRIRAKTACGDPNQRICKYCKRYDLVDHLYVDKHKWTAHYHRECKVVVDRIRKRKLKEIEVSI